MTRVQTMIDAMHKGDVNVIVQCITSNTLVLVWNAIVAGTHNNVHDERFIDGLIRAEGNTETLMGIPVQNVATAALHVLGEKKYSGNDKQINAMIDTKFDM